MCMGKNERGEEVNDYQFFATFITLELSSNNYFHYLKKRVQHTSTRGHFSLIPNLSLSLYFEMYQVLEH